ncbi:MAG: tetratricopeptide repeat protein [Planctomycetota bacterium]
MLMRSLLIAVALVLQAGAVLAKPADLPDISPIVSRLLEADYLRDSERAELRTFHGQWSEDDLEDPGLREQAAMVAAYPIRVSDEADPFVRAHLAILNAEPRVALRLLPDDPEEAEAVWLVATAHLQLGHDQHARTVLESLDPEMTYWSVRAQLLLESLRETPAERYHELNALLTALRNAERLDWRVRLLEAELLLQRGVLEDGTAALFEAMALNPKSAEAWALLGGLSVQSLRVEQSFAIADRLDALAREVSGEDQVVHPMGAIIRARMHLRIDDPGSAETALEASIEQFPKMPALLAWRAGVAAARFDFDETEARLSDLDAVQPGSSLGFATVASVLHQQRQYQQAAEYYGRAIAIESHNPDLHADLGQLQLMVADYGAALLTLDRAHELDPFNARADNRLRLVREMSQLKEVETEHFIIRYDPSMDEAIARDMLAHLELMHERLKLILGHEPRRKTNIEIAPDLQRFAVRMVGLPESHTIAASSGPVIMIESPRIGAKHTGEFHWLNVMQHEYVHTVTIDQTNNRIPTWFTEAIAVENEGALRLWGTWQSLAQALQNDLLFDQVELNNAFARVDLAQQRSLAYAQSNWMYQYILETYGEEATRQMLRYQADGRTDQESIEKALNTEIDAFHQAFREWALEDLIRHGVVAKNPLRELYREAVLFTDRHEAHRMNELRALAESTALTIVSEGRAERARVALPELDEIELELLGEQHPGHPEILEQLVGFALGRSGGNVTGSNADLLQRYARARPVHDQPHRLLASYYLDTEQIEKAVEHLEWLDSREQYSWAYATELARFYAKKGDWERAFDKAERAAIIAPYRPEHRELAAAAAIRAGDIESAERHLEALVLIEPDREIHQRRLEALRERLGGTN